MPRHPRIAATSHQAETLTQADEYFVAAPTCSTMSKKYAWLCNTQMIGKMTSVNNQRAQLDLFVVR